MSLKKKSVDHFKQQIIWEKEELGQRLRGQEGGRGERERERGGREGQSIFFIIVAIFFKGVNKLSRKSDLRPMNRDRKV